MKSKGRTPKATNVENFADSAFASRDPGQWPAILREAWEAHNDKTQPRQYAPDNIENRGARASQYNS